MEGSFFRDAMIIYFIYALPFIVVVLGNVFFDLHIRQGTPLGTRGWDDKKITKFYVKSSITKNILEILVVVSVFVNFEVFLVLAFILWAKTMAKMFVLIRDIKIGLVHNPNPLRKKSIVVFILEIIGVIFPFLVVILVSSFWLDLGLNGGVDVSYSVEYGYRPDTFWYLITSGVIPVIFTGIIVNISYLLKRSTLYFPTSILSGLRRNNNIKTSIGDMEEEMAKRNNNDVIGVKRSSDKDTFN